MTIDGNLLLTWLSHNGEGSWEAFRRGIASMASDVSSEDEFRDVVPRLRYRLSDMGCVEFDHAKRRRWFALPPLVVTTADNPNRAVICGARTPGLLNRLTTSSADCNVVIQRVAQEYLPDWISMSGEADAIKSAARMAQIRHAGDVVAEFATRLEPLELVAARAPEGHRMIGWSERHFDPKTGRWEASCPGRTVVECRPTYGSPLYLVQVSRTKTIQMPRREAILLSLAINNRKVVRYDKENEMLIVPTYAPLPDRCSRLACLASQRCGTVSGGMVEYAPVPEQVARFILATIGQS